MADSREIGMRLGAAGNQAAIVVGHQVFAGALNVENIGSEYERLLRGFVSVMDRVQSEMEGAAQAAPAPSAPAQIVQQVADTFNATPAAPAAAPAVTPQVAEVLGTTPNPQYGYDTNYSGSSKPLKLAEHPELPQWLHAQAAALGCTQVWDNRGKPNFVQAIAEGRAKTPPPFRSATDGVDKGFWPPSN